MFGIICSFIALLIPAAFAALALLQLKKDSETEIAK